MSCMKMIPARHWVSWSWFACLAPLAATPGVQMATTFAHAAVPDPVDIDIAADGTIFLGRDHAGSGGRYEDAVRIHRIGPGGAPVEEFGDTAPADPDAVFIDRTGSITGTPGAVVVGGALYGYGSMTGKITSFTPAGTSATLLSLPNEISNPAAFTVDAQGRLLFIAYNPNGTSSQVLRLENGSLSNPVSISFPSDIAFDALGRFVISSDADQQVRVFTPEGAPVDSHPIGKPSTPLATAKGGFWGNATYLLDSAGHLIRLETDGSSRIVGSGFHDTSDLVFGDDDCLYLSEFDNDRVLRIEPKPRITVTQAEPLRLELAAPRDRHYRIDFSGTLQPDDWMPLTNITPTTWPHAFDDPTSSGVNQRFYRAVEVP